MDAKEVLELISKGEGHDIEFKSWKNARSKKDLLGVITREVVSFANSKGGYILLGVEDDGSITGCSDYDTQNILGSIYDRTRPPIFTTIDEMDIDGKTILVIKVEKSNDMHSTSSGEVLKRLGKDNKPLYPDQYHQTQIRKSDLDYSSYLLNETNEEDINPLEVYRLKEKLKARDPESTLLQLSDKAFLNNLNLLKVQDKKERLTVAGLLFTGKEESIRNYLPQAEVMYFHYKNSTDVEYDKRIDMKLPLISVLDRLTQIIEDNNHIENVQVGLFRLEIKDYPIHVFQEALLNSMCHRDYLSNGAVIVRHYPDRIVIENPGAFPEGINGKNVITHPPVARNKLIAETLQSLKYVQRAGQGVDIIYRDMLVWSKPAPVYSLYTDAVALTLRSSLTSKSFVSFIAREQDQNQTLFSTAEIILLYYLKDNREIDISKASELIQEQEDESRMILNGLVDRGYIERNGRQFILTQKVYESFGDDTGYIKDKMVDYIRAKRMILEYIKTKGFITNSICRDLCGYDARKSRYTLKKMQEEGLIQLVGEKKQSRYVLK